MAERLVIIPTYNEQENIREILGHVFRLDPVFHVLVVDDGSPDGTAGTVKELQAEYPDRLHLLERSGKLGLGTAYIMGFKWALERGYTYIFEMDADFSHDPDDLVRLYEACAKDGADMSIGSRYVKGGHVRDWSWDRILLSWSASMYVRSILWLGVRDTTAGFVCYHERVLRTLALDDIRFVGYAFQIEMKYRARLAGFRIAEVPITFVDRLKGTSKMSANIFREAVLGVWRMRFAVKQRRAEFALP
ncbi:MAG TPA: polyprenol monophosphomannose synthase [Flavobacteriales bacterium]|nr:polyprenol monophosphomannose synthase [Flavobacteriales bacterium]HMZ47684.1 polyprenol monophosphomannose synthase [Flavobacteriales bacterium]HNA32102.1 polyprenol monophosphomannose synthase [Flavobacteriales bacterium]HNE79626.1 polyprenol monophosphomannose synthase [Flavobacteriales bacterium]HNI03341.1 polyprenol monophosphomannose synthase [Flavobacteriales bacterium]